MNFKASYYASGNKFAVSQKHNMPSGARDPIPHQSSACTSHRRMTEIHSSDTCMSLCCAAYRLPVIAMLPEKRLAHHTTAHWQARQSTYAVLKVLSQQHILNNAEHATHQFQQTQCFLILLKS